MSKTTMVLAGLLVALGVSVFVSLGSDDPELLIPAFFGLLLLFCGWMSFNRSRRMIWMPIAIVVAAVGFIFPLVRGVQAIVQAYSENDDLARPLAVTEELVMSGLCLLITAMGVRRFLAASRANAA